MPQLPDNFRPRWLLSLGLKIPAAQDCFESETLLAKAGATGLEFVVFRPAWLTTAPAKRSYGYCFDITGMDNEALPLRDEKSPLAGRMSLRRSSELRPSQSKSVRSGLDTASISWI